MTFFFFLHENICCGYSLEAPHPTTYVFMKNKKDIRIFRMKKVPYLDLCFTNFLEYENCRIMIDHIFFIFTIKS